MSRYWSDVVKSADALCARGAASLTSLVKLNTNESPYPPSPMALQAIREVTADELRLYPDPESVA